MHDTSAPLPIVVLISGSGSNLQAIIDDAAHKALPVEIRAVISNNPNAFGLERARRAGIPALVLDHKSFPGRDAFDAALQTMIDRFEPALVVLAGFMRILGPGFVTHYLGHMLNIHPSLLPAFAGLDTHNRALEAGMREHGASVHFVTNELDGGPVIVQARVPILPDDNVKTLAQRVLVQEHHIYPVVIHWFAEGRLQLDQEHNQVVLDGTPLTSPVDYTDANNNPQTTRPDPQ